MEVQTESIYVVRMTRLDAAKVLVSPRELQEMLRGRLQTDAEAAEAQMIDGQTVTPRLPAGRDGRSKGEDLPATRRAMRKYRATARRSSCPHCGKAFKRLGLHLVKAHPERTGEAA
jgi:hypothetical protein